LTNAGQLHVVFDQLETLESADLWVTIDRGPRTSWLRRLLGLTDRDILPCFYLVKEGDYAAITFLDENWSEYRAIDPEQPSHASKEIRLRIAMSQGEWTPLEAEYCLNFSRALEAIRYFAKEASRPDWLSYKYVR
jgi:hypothetical protein